MFKNKPQNQVSDDVTPDTPYKKAEQEWTYTVGSAKASAANWRLMAFGLLFFSMASLAGTYYFANRSTVVPYIVEVDSKSGALISTNKVYSRSDANKQEIEYFIWQILKKARTIPKDIVLYEKNWSDVYTFLDSQTSQKFNDMANREHHRQKLQEGTTTMLTLKAITPISNQEDTYNVRWSEVRYSSDGKKSAEYELEAYFTMQQVPLNEKNVYVNPLGLKVKDFSISQVQ